MYWDDIGIKNIAHIHPPAPYLTFEPTSDNLLLVTSNAIVVVAATVTATAVGGNDNGGNSDGRGHRQ
jgi:hypothetical protein